MYVCVLCCCARTPREECVFKNDYDVMIKNARVRGSTMGSLLSAGTISDRLAEIMGEKEEEEVCGKPADNETRRDDNEIWINDINESDEENVADCNADKALKAKHAQQLADPEGKLKQWKRFAENVFHKYVKIVPDPNDQDTLANLLQESAICKLTPDANQETILAQSLVVLETRCFICSCCVPACVICLLPHRVSAWVLGLGLACG